MICVVVVALPCLAMLQQSSFALKVSALSIEGECIIKAKLPWLIWVLWPLTGHGALQPLGVFWFKGFPAIKRARMCDMAEDLRDWLGWQKGSP